ncbi:endoribonuclease Dicer-like [Panonychus citri]|uniref:endoribonuclease Dicer-like n=1 Tax=Panonychus citri TaxID=50023 RepID=UPI00230821AE|nr:endoribonuclease Dicer-like [Panonychus citri]
MDLYEEVKKKNVVTFFDNDGYRRFISLCVINHFSYQIRDGKSNGTIGKRSVILVSDPNQIALESKTIRNHTNLSVEELVKNEDYLEMDVNSWNQLIADHHVLVMNCSLFSTLLSRSLITLSTINLIILNNCHLVLTDDSYKQLSIFLQSCDPLNTRLLAFSPSLMKCNRKPAEIEAIICQMEKKLQASRNTSTDFQMSYRLSVKPKGKIIYYDDYLLTYDLYNPNVIGKLLDDLKTMINGCQHVFTQGTGINGFTLLQIIRTIFNTTKTMGTYCAMELAEIYAKELSELIINCKDVQLSSILASTLSFCQYVQVIFRQQLSLFYINHQLQVNVSEKMLSILKVLLDFIPNPELLQSENVKNPSGLHGIIFAKDRTTVRLLCAWLSGVSENLEQFNFLKVDYLVPNNKMSKSKDFPSTSRLETMMHKYRKQEVNLLVISTSYEEELEVTKCNLVIRYDFPSTFTEYLNSKQKLRTDNGKYVLFIPKNEPTKSLCEQKLSEFVSLENIMKSKELEIERPPPFELLADEFPPFKTCKEATVELANSMFILHRYCTRLPSDTFTHLVPIYSNQTLENGQIQCTLYLPTNSPVRGPITGQPANHHEIAQRSAALEACKALHAAGEINDLLWPVGKENSKCLEELGIKRHKRGPRGENVLDRPGTTKRRQSYQKSVAESLKGGDIIPGEPCYMYIFLMSLTCPIPEDQNTRGRKLVDPMDSPRFFGLITKSRISRICDFPVYTRSGEVIVSMKATAEKIKFDEDQIEKLKQFHRFTFNDVLHLVKDPMVYDPIGAPSTILIVPVNYMPTISKSLPTSFTIDSNCVSIDWMFIDKVLIYERTDHTKEKTDFKFDRSVFEDAVVKPWYRSANEQLPFYVANICDDLRPTSPFPTDTYATFYDYYLSKYGIEITDKDQSLLDVDHTSARLNFLTPRFVNRKGMPLPKSTEKTRTAKRENLQSKQLLVPELCIVHPFSASYWNKAVCLPSILYRVNHLLIADQLRRQVALDIGIGVTKDDPQFSWPALDFGWSLTEVLNQPDDEFDLPVAKSSNTKTSKSKNSIKNCVPSSSISTNIPPTPSAPSKSIPIESPSVNPVPVPMDNDNNDDLLIDTFDPNIYKVEPIEEDNDLGEIPPVGNWDQNDYLGGAFEIDPMSFDAGIDYDLDDDLDDEPRIVELDNDGNPIKQSNGFRVGSPSNFDLNGDTTNNWMAESTGPNTIIDLNIPGLNLITTGIGVDLQNLSEDLKNIHAYDDFDNSEDEDEDEDPDDDCDQDFEDHFDQDQLLIPDSDDTIEIAKEEKCKDILTSGLILSSHNDEPEKSDEISIYDQIEIPDPWVDPNIVSNAQLDKEKIENIFSYDEIIVQNDEISNEDESINEIIMKLDADLEVLKPIVLPKHNNSSTIKTTKTDKQSLDRDEKTLGEVIPSFGELLPNRDEIIVSGESETKHIHLDPLNEEFDPEIGPSPAMVLQALTMSNASDGINLERLETVGDSFLKYAVTVFMYCRCHQHEGILSQLRSTQISNLKLYELGSEKNLGELMVATKFEPSDNWLPPGFKIPGGHFNLEVSTSESGEKVEKFFNCLSTQQSIPDKSIADCVEALIGAYLISCGPRGALLFMRWLGVMVMDDVQEPQPETGLWRWLNPIKPPLFPNAPQDDLDKLYLSYGLDRFEKQIIQYEFKDKAYLVQAFTHNSFSDNRVTDCYQRLEFLGDAVLDFLITRHLFDDPRQHSPGVLTDLRSALANNTFFASLAVEYEFHKYLMYKTADLHKVIARFVEHHASNGKLRDPSALLLLRSEDDDCQQPEDIEVPKALGDVFESVAGAIYLDSGFSLDTVWRVYYNMMKPEMEYFSKNPPKSPIRELLEMKPQKVSFSKPEDITIHGIAKVRMSVEVFNLGKFVGIGRNRRLAKYTAAKRALRDLKAPNSNSKKAHL